MSTNFMKGYIHYYIFNRKSIPRNKMGDKFKTR